MRVSASTTSSRVADVWGMDEPCDVLAGARPCPDFSESYPASNLELRPWSRRLVGPIVVVSYDCVVGPCSVVAELLRDEL